MSDNNTVKRFEGTARLNIDGRVVIPAFLRKPLGIAPGDLIDLVYEDGLLFIRKSNLEDDNSDVTSQPNPNPKEK